MSTFNDDLPHSFPIHSIDKRLMPTIPKSILLYILSATMMFSLFGIIYVYDVENYVLQYISLWLAFNSIFMIFIARATYTAKFLKQASILEIPVYLTFMIMGLNALFAVIPLIDPSELIVQLTSSQIIDGLMLACIGLLCFWGGYGLFVSISPTSVKFKAIQLTKIYFDFQQPNLHLVAVAYLLVCLLRLSLIFLGGGDRIYGDDILGLNEWEQWLTYILLSRYIFIAIISISYAKGDISLISFILMLGLEAFLAFVSGWSSELIKLAIVAWGSLSLYNKQIKTFYLLIFALIVIYLVPIIRDFREIEITSFPVLIEELEDYIGNFDLLSGLEFVGDVLVDRQGGSSQMSALIMVKTPSQIGYKPIEELLLSPFAFVPRIFWRDKPEYATIGRYITNVYLGYSNMESNAAVTPSASLYMYGGYTVVIIGMFILGIFLSFITKVLFIPSVIRSSTMILSLYVGSMIRVFHLGEGSFVTVVSTMIQTLSVFGIITLILSIRLNLGYRNHNA